MTRKVLEARRGSGNVLEYPFGACVLFCKFFRRELIHLLNFEGRRKLDKQKIKKQIKKGFRNRSAMKQN